MQKSGLWVLGILLILVLPGCAGQRTVFSVPPGGGAIIVPMQADSFSFSPGIIRARQGDRLVLRVANAAGMEHNLTVDDPLGRRVLSVDLPAGETVEVPLELTEGGIWAFYCDKPLHKSLGMTGRIEAPLSN